MLFHVVSFFFQVSVLRTRMHSVQHLRVRLGVSHTPSGEGVVSEFLVQSQPKLARPSLRRPTWTFRNLHAIASTGHRQQAHASAGLASCLGKAGRAAGR